MESLLWIAVVVAAWIGYRLFLNSWDRKGIRETIQEQGGVVQNISWVPFGQGWLDSKHARIYDIIYQDTNGKCHRATCKTRFFAGINVTDDKIEDEETGWESEALLAKMAEPLDEKANLMEENQRLHEEVERLREEIERLGRERGK